MTVAVAWVATRSDKRQDLYFASDSRTTGGLIFDACPKIMLLPRGDCAMCFAGDVSMTYALVLHVSCAIKAHEPARERNLDVAEVKTHLLRLLNDLVQKIRQKPAKIEKGDLQFIFGGFSWRSGKFRIWSFNFDPLSRSFHASESGTNWNPRLGTVAFIGDWAAKFRRRLFLALRESENDRPANSEPLKVLSELLKEKNDSIGGPPQVVRIGPHMNGREFCVLWDERPHLFGRPLLSYEHCDYWVVDPDTGKISPPGHIKLLT